MNIVPLLFTSICLGLTACQHPSTELASCCARPDPDAGKTAGEFAPLPGDSIYQLNEVFTDQHQQDTAFAALRGHPRLLTMFFSHCEYACPIIVGDLKKIEARLSEEERSRLFVSLISFDVDRDTPEVLAAYALKMGMDPNRWQLLHGDASAVRSVAAALGVRYRREATGGFAHSNMIFLVSPEGQILHVQEGLAASPEEMVAAFRATLKETSTREKQ